MYVFMNLLTHKDYIKKGVCISLPMGVLAKKANALVNMLLKRYVMNIIGSPIAIPKSIFLN